MAYSFSFKQVCTFLYQEDENLVEPYTIKILTLKVPIIVFNKNIEVTLNGAQQQEQTKPRQVVYKWNRQ